jgi:DNA recombination protein RmuC
LLSAETSKLVNALKAPQVRGRWGEVALRRTAELAGMTPYCDFEEQVSVSSEDGLFRPDMRIRLPAGRGLIVDSKVPLAAFLEALEANTDEQRTACLAKHAKQVAAHVDKLAAKEYWRQFEATPEFVVPEFVVLFIPNDSFLAAAAEQNPELVEIALSKKVVLATPTTFVALLRAIEYGWRQQIAVENALRIRNLGQELSDRFSNLVEHLTRVGAALTKSVEAYNSAVGTFESRILPTARRFKDLGAVGRKEIEELHTIDDRPRDLPVLDDEEEEEE